MRLSNGRSSLEIIYKMCVCQEQNECLLAMDFLTDFQCVIDVDKEETISLNRTPRERLAYYRRPFLKLPASSESGEASLLTTLVDTGATTRITYKIAKEKNLELMKTNR